MGSSQAMAKVKFTAGRVTGHKCEAGKSQSFLWDSEAPGLGLRAASKGGKAYIFQGKLNGQAIRVTIGAPATWDIPAAQAEARRLKVIIDNGQDPRQVKSDAQAKARSDKANTAAVKDAAQAEAIRQSATIAEAWAVYLTHHAKRWGARHMADHINLSQAA